MADINELVKIQSIFEKKFGKDPELVLEGQHDVIYIFSYENPEVNKESFLSEEDVSEIGEFRPGFHYSNDADCWATFT